MNAYEKWEESTAAERAAVTDAEFAGVVRAALMSEGLLASDADDADASEVKVPEPAIPGAMLWCISEQRAYSDIEPLMAFRTQEEAAKALEALQGALLIRKDWDMEARYVEPGNFAALVELCPTRDDLESVRAAVKSAREIRKERTKEVEARKARQRDAAAITQRLLTERARAGDRERKLEEIRRTYREYQEIAGDNGKASLYLAKVYNVADINEALGTPGA